MSDIPVITIRPTTEEPEEKPIEKQGILQTAFKPYVDVAKGIYDPVSRYENYPKTYEEYVDTLVNEDGINKLTGKTREDLLNNPYKKESFISQREQRVKSAVADQLSGESKYDRFAKGTANYMSDTALLFAALPNDLPGEFLDDFFTMENIGRLRRKYEVDLKAAEELLSLIHI